MILLSITRITRKVSISSTNSLIDTVIKSIVYIGTDPAILVCITDA